jgi:beta-phosphoglucomutase-like phosphatase (HAD superfamily)
MRPSTPIAALFDVEGTLIDCVALQLESWRVTLSEAGYSFTHRDLQPFSPMDRLWMLDRLLPKESQDCKERLLKAQGESYRRDLLPRAQPFPEVRLLFEALKRRARGATVPSDLPRDQETLEPCSAHSQPPRSPPRLQ